MAQRPRDYAAEYRARQAKARREGYRSYGAKRHALQKQKQKQAQAQRQPQKSVKQRVQDYINKHPYERSQDWPDDETSDFWKLYTSLTNQ